jgi:glucose-6-phosphate 1-epimerase
MNEVERLNQYYSIDGQLLFVEGPDGMIFVEVDNPHATARIALQGAQVLLWNPKGEEPVIWLSEDARFAAAKSVRGGVPICWPWFGAHTSEAGFPAHGYARTTPWEVEMTEAMVDGQTRLVFGLVESELTESFWPHVTPVQCRITIGKTLQVELITRNEGAEAVTITEALHTYFRIGDIRQVRISGLENSNYLDKVQDFQQFTQKGMVEIGEEVDRVYIDTDHEVVIDDPLLKRRIHINKRGSHSTIVWNPWSEKAAQMGDMGENGYQYMVCVESGNAFNNAVTIEAGGEHHLQVSYSLEH